ncbi:hypothetical protein LWI29_037039 [Acer saccharum]|uniref:Jacalin-type lectin domain-containing protein n=1 Tax=Acer saccharum TaxID=4024 RepID=A0AA39W0A8_ACESA|nr:hypothetical protein LWI29_037039 [Acer saccharum]
MVEKASFSFEHSRNELEAFQIGPLGEVKGSTEWSYKSKGAITGIMITCDPYAVVSLNFKGVEENGNTEYSDTFGFHDKAVYKIMLDWPQEYFTSLSGTYYLDKSVYYFSSLCFHTNRKKYGPFGHPEKSIPFEFPMNGRVIAGFYGSTIVNKNWIHGTLGVYVKHSTDMFGPQNQVQVVKPRSKVIRSIFNQEECIKVGPWGWSRSSTEEEWSYMLKGATKIKIGYNGESIKWISFESSDENGEVKHSVQKSNSTSGEKHEVISLNWPEEYLVSISMTLRDTVQDIESLCFYTNRTIYGPFGTMKSPNFPLRFYMKGGIIVGFYGYVGEYFDALGAYIKPFSEMFSSSGQGEIVNSKAGPFGGQGGKEWNYKPNGAITEIKISHGRVIDSLSFKSVDISDKCEYSDRFGGEGGDTDLITMDWPKEYLTSISGTHHSYKKQHVIESICFHTNKMTYGPFGGTQGSPFDLPLKDRDIVGFYGRASNYIDAIGVYQQGTSS